MCEPCVQDVKEKCNFLRSEVKLAGRSKLVSSGRAKQLRRVWDPYSFVYARIKNEKTSVESNGVYGPLIS